MRRPLRVLHMIQNLNYGGMEKLLADIVLRMDADLVESHVLCFGYLGRFSEGIGHAATFHLSSRQSRLSMLWPREVQSQIRRIDPDVVHSHGGVWYKSAVAARRAGVRRIIHTEHGRMRPDPWVNRTVDGIASRHTDVVVAVSELLRHQLIDTVVRGPAQVLTVLNGVDTEAFTPASSAPDLRAELGIPPEAFVLGSIGRLEAIKGYDVMLEAFRRLLERSEDLPDVRLVVGGDGAERGRLDAVVDEAHLGGRVQLLGWRDDVHTLHATFDLFTMSSRSEGTSVSLLEAMSAGLCPVVTDVGGNGAVLGSGLEHRLIPSEDPAALAEAWRAAILQDAERNRDGGCARMRVCENFSLKRMVEAYLELYQTGTLAERTPLTQVSPS